MTTCAEQSERLKCQFLKDLRDLLATYGATLEAEDHWTGYPECGEDVRMTVDIPAIYDNDGDTVRDACQINLGKYQDGEESPR